MPERRKLPNTTTQNPAFAVPSINWSIIASFFVAIYNFASKLLWLFIVAVIVVILIEGVTRYSTVIEPISVPKFLAERGYTADVAAVRLRDAMLKFVTSTNTKMKNPDLVSHGALPDIIVPTVGISLNAVTATVRTLFRITRSRSLTGELTIKKDLLWLRLRLDGVELYDSPNGVDPEHPDDLFAAAIPKIFEVIRPYFVAASIVDTNPKRALEVVRKYINQLPESDENVIWLYNLQGNIYKDKRDYDNASAAYIKAYTLDPSYAYAHFNLGTLFAMQGNRDKAIAEYQKAIKIDPKFANAHTSLGNIFKAEGMPNEAIAEYRNAIELDPKDALAHRYLGIMLKEQGKIDEAIAEYHKAIELDPKDMLAHRNLSVILMEQGKTDEADAESRKAIEFDPKNATSNNKLGAVSDGQGEAGMAIAEYHEPIDFDGPPTAR